MLQNNVKVASSARSDNENSLEQESYSISQSDLKITLTAVYTVHKSLLTSTYNTQPSTALDNTGLYFSLG